jgi:hypothetical protein
MMMALHHLADSDLQLGSGRSFQVEAPEASPWDHLFKADPTR